MVTLPEPVPVLEFARDDAVRPRASGGFGISSTDRRA